MKTAAIIAEYAPFHNGHRFHIDETRRQTGATHFIAVMSGNFTQRGDVAFLDKWSRAEHALRNGIDLVIEIPTPYVLGGAGAFASAAVSMLCDLGCADIISFGSECGDTELLKEAAGAVHYAEDHPEFIGRMRRGMSYPEALEKTIFDIYTDDVSAVFRSPNNILAIEYIKAMNNAGAAFRPFTIKREGTRHDGAEIVGNIASAGQIRKMNASGEDVSRLLPGYTLPGGTADIASLSHIERAILAQIRTLSPDEIKKAPCVLQGLENRIYKAARAARSLSELAVLSGTKRYPMSRLRRIFLCLYLSITKSDLKSLSPPYIRILGMNGRGKEILSAAKRETSGAAEQKTPVDTSLTALAKTSPEAKKLAAREAHCGDLYALSFGKVRKCGGEFSGKPVIIDD
ncbi:UPF0348 protein [Clostridia bacterium]|nr:UPF0348 protein [Clostridia bacterium]